MYSIDSAPARINHIRDTNAPNVLSVHRLRMICVRGPWPRTNHTYDILYIYYIKLFTVHVYISACDMRGYKRGGKNNSTV